MDERQDSPSERDAESQNPAAADAPSARQERRADLYKALEEIVAKQAIIEKSVSISEAAQEEVGAFLKALAKIQNRLHGIVIKFASVAISVGFLSWSVAFFFEWVSEPSRWHYLVLAIVFFALFLFFAALTIERFRLRALLEKLFSDYD